VTAGGDAGPAAVSGAAAALRASLSERLAAFRDDIPESLLDVTVRREGGVYLVMPADWEQLRHDEGGAGRGVPYWARPWPSGLKLAETLAADPPPRGARVLELGCGLAAPSIAAARAGARVLATDASLDAVVFAAHCLALNEVEGEVAQADWAAHGDELVRRGPWDLVIASDVLYTRANVDAAARLFPRLGAPVLLADPNRAGARDFLASARASFALETTRGASGSGGERSETGVSLHRLTPRVGRGAKRRAQAPDSAG
jgi:predicted nicotinamide N-methyase